MDSQLETGKLQMNFDQTGIRPNLALAFIIMFHKCQIKNIGPKKKNIPSEKFHPNVNP